MLLLDSLLELQLGGNRLSGVIRSLPANLQIALNLSSNNFEGPIPDSLSRLQALEVMDLSNNRFSGAIPSNLTQMGSLTHILLSNNLLTGVVPRFNSHVIVSYGGNINLSYPPPKPSVDKKNNSRVSVGIVVASTAAVVTLIICYTPLIVKCYKEERRKSEGGRALH
ncbi:putative non-specific serine/threonine protein kinase [Helianthus anomalus]